MRLGVRLYSRISTPRWRTLPLIGDNSRTVDYLRLHAFCLSPVGIDVVLKVASSSNRYGIDIVDSWKHEHDNETMLSPVASTYNPCNFEVILHLKVPLITHNLQRYAVLTEGYGLRGLRSSLLPRVALGSPWAFFRKFQIGQSHLLPWMLRPLATKQVTSLMSVFSWIDDIG